MPHLNEINQKYSSRGLKIVAVSNEQADAIEKKGVRALGMNFGVARSSGASRLYGVSGIPDSFIIGKDGKILWRGHPGYINDEMLAAWLGGQPLPEGAPASSAGSGASSMFMKLGIFILLSGVAIFFVLRMLKPRAANAPAYPAQAWQQPPGGPPAAQAPQGGSPPPAPSNNCSHCGAPKREGRKSCMGCGAPF